MTFRSALCKLCCSIPNTSAHLACKMCFKIFTTPTNYNSVFCNSSVDTDVSTMSSFWSSWGELSCDVQRKASVVKNSLVWKPKVSDRPISIDHLNEISLYFLYRFDEWNKLTSGSIERNVRRREPFVPHVRVRDEFDLHHIFCGSENWRCNCTAVSAINVRRKVTS